MTGNEKDSAEHAERDEVSRGLTPEEKQQLFMKKLYRLSKQHLDETPEERLFNHNPRDLKSSVESNTTFGPPSPSPVATFVERLSVVASACTGIDYLCTGRSTDAATKGDAKNKDGGKKKMRSLLSRPDIPAVVTLSPSRVSLLEDDDSLAKYMATLAGDVTLVTTVHSPSTLSHPIGHDDVSDDSPQGVDELANTYTIEKIRRIKHEQVEEVRLSESSMGADEKEV